MSWKELTLCAAIFAGTFGHAAEQAKIKAGDDYTLEFAKDKLFIQDSQNRRRMLIGKLFYTWTPQAATPTSAEVVDDNTMKIDYAVSVPDDPKKTPEQNAKAKADAEGITLSALCTTGDNRVKIVYTLVSPKVRPDGMMMEILGQDGTAKKPNYEATVWKVRPFGGRLSPAKGGTFRPFANGNATFWLRLPGNAGWSSGWAEHGGFRKNGDGTYTSELDFIITPSDFSGADVAAVFRNDPVSMSFTENELVIRNLGYKAVRDAELSLDGKDRTVSFEPGEVKKFAFEPGGSAVSATLKIGEKVYAAAQNPKK